MVAVVSGAWTPGPWSPFYANRSTVNTTQDRRGFYRCVVIQIPSAEIVAESRGKYEIEAQANARLIAAAPELYASGKATDDLLRRMQRLVTDYVIPDGGLADETFINEIIGLLDGPEQRAAQHALQDALSAARGDHE